MGKSDTLLWVTMGIMLVVFLPVGLIMLAYLMLKMIYSMITPTESTNTEEENEIERPPTEEEKKTHNILLYDANFKQNELSNDEADKAR